MFRVWEKPRGSCFHSLSNFSNSWGFSYTSANLKPPRTSEPSSRLSALHGKKKDLLSATGYFRAMILESRGNLGGFQNSEPGPCGAAGCQAIKCLLFLWSDFTDSSAGEPPGRVRFFSLWSVAVFSAHKLKSILPILSDLQIWSQGSFPGGGDLVPVQRAASHRHPPESQSFW